ncbi:MAG: PIN domain-containing protein, partial [Candidatus Micrarchaeota archaeon]
TAQQEEKGGCLVDSNVLIYSLMAGTGEKKSEALDLLLGLCERKEYCLSVQNLAETARVLLEKTESHADCASIVSSLETHTQNASIFSYSKKTVASAIGLSSQNKVYFFDALLAATMKENGVSVIYTENTKDFSKIPGIRAINPFKKRGK